MTTDTRHAVEQIVQRVLVDEHGADAITRRPISRTIDVEVDRPADYLAGIAAARRIANVADSLMRDYAKRARGEGLSWREIAGALPINPDATDHRSGAAFLWVAPSPSMPFDDITTSWECASCGQRVTDRGPFNGHPADDEDGHAEGCARHAEDIRAWRALSGWDEDEA